MNAQTEEGVTIIICTFNGLNKLDATLTHIEKLQADFPWELIVVDNASTDGTFEFVQQFLSGRAISHQLLTCATPGKMFAFWHGVNHARYKYVLDCDDDNHLREDYLLQGYSILESNPRIGALGGWGTPLVKEELPDWFDQFSRSYAVGPQASVPGKLPKHSYLYGAGCFFRKRPLRELSQKGYNSILSCRKGDLLTSGGDTELCMAIELAGYEIWYSDKLRFGHALNSSRLKWEYYLRLKEGSALGFPLLLAFRFSDFEDVRAFKRFLKRQYVIAWKGYIKTTLQLILSRDKTIQVANRVCKTKLKAFRANYEQTMSEYSHLKNLFANS